MQALRDQNLPAIFLPVLEHERLADLIAACDVFALPSHAEGLPTMLCETMNSGRAIVATDVGGIPEIVKDGVTGFVVPKGDVDRLTSRLRTVLIDRPLRERFEREAHQFAREHLTWRSNALAYTKLYERVSLLGDSTEGSNDGALLAALPDS